MTICLHDAPAVERWCRENKLDPGYLRRLRTAVYKRGVAAEQAAEALPAPQRAAWRTAIRARALALAEELPSARDGAIKFVFRTAQGLLIESVLMRIASGRRTLCLSSQVGCAAQCLFCATGRMGLLRQLSAAEMVDQVAQANAHLAAREGPAARVRNLVFMGMGEPLHNERQLCEALELLTRRDLFAYAPRRIAVSTVGVPDGMVRLAERFPGVRQALSLHAAREELRRELVPLARVHSLAELREAIAAVARIGQQKVMIEYLLLRGVNDHDDDLESLVALLRGLDVHINLIPYNPVWDAPFAGTPLPRRVELAARLKAAGFPVTLRYSLGADIGAACGQLVRRDNERLAPSLSSLEP